MKGILPNFGHRCIWGHRYADYRFWGQKAKVTAGGDITVDGNPSSSIYSIRIGIILKHGAEMSLAVRMNDLKLRPTNRSTNISKPLRE